MSMLNAIYKNNGEIYRQELMNNIVYQFKKFARRWNHNKDKYNNKRSCK